MSRNVERVKRNKTEPGAKERPPHWVCLRRIPPSPTNIGGFSVLPGSQDQFQLQQRKGSVWERKRGGRGRGRTDVLRGSSISTCPPLHVASQHFPFRVPNLTFGGGRLWHSQTPQKTCSVAAVVATRNLPGTESLGSTHTHRKPQILLCPRLTHSWGEMFKAQPVCQS